MTYNNVYGAHKVCEQDRDCAKCKPKHPKSEKILLECGQGTGSRSFTSSEDNPFQLANVTVDTTCLNRSEILIKFSSLVRLDKIELFGSRRVRLKYELFRTCNGEEPKSLGTWMFEKAETIPENDIRFNLIEETFSFIFCESSAKCLGCCSYFVRVSPLELTNSTATVSNGQIAALTETLCPRDTILVCGQGNGGIVFKDMDDPALLLPADIAHVTVDTTSLNKPKILIEFSCLIKLAEDIDDAIILFELFRVCGDTEPVSRGVWRFELTNSDELISKAFSFIFCECQTVSKCCDYFVKVIPIEIDDDEEDDVTVYNARMTAIAQSSKESLPSDCINSKLFHDKSKEVLLECGNGTGSRTFTSLSDLPFQLAHVTIDTSSFCKPIVNIQFSSIVSYQVPNIVNDTSIQLRYELFRKCENRRLLSLGVWELQVTNEDDSDVVIESTESFDFTFCDCITCPGCCDYFVQVTVIELVESSDVIPTFATVSNGRIAALAGEI